MRAIEFKKKSDNWKLETFSDHIWYSCFKLFEAKNKSYRARPVNHFYFFFIFLAVSYLHIACPACMKDERNKGQ